MASKWKSYIENIGYAWTPPVNPGFPTEPGNLENLEIVVVSVHVLK